MYEAVIVLSVTYGNEISLMSASDGSRVEADEMRCLRSMRGITKCDREEWKNLRVVELKMKVGERAENAILKWYVWVTRTWECKVVILRWFTNHEWEQGKDRPRKRWEWMEWMQELEVMMSSSEIICVNDRESWWRMYKSMNSCSWGCYNAHWTGGHAAGDFFFFFFLLWCDFLMVLTGMNVWDVTSV